MLELGQRKTNEYLDIVNVIEIQDDVRLLLKLLLDRKQRWLFKNQRQRTLHLDTDQNSSDNDFEFLYKA